MEPDSDASGWKSTEGMEDGVKFFSKKENGKSQLNCNEEIVGQVYEGSFSAVVGTEIRLERFITAIMG